MYGSISIYQELEWYIGDLISRDLVRLIIIRRNSGIKGDIMKLVVYRAYQGICVVRFQVRFRLPDSFGLVCRLGFG